MDIRIDSLEKNRQGVIINVLQIMHTEKELSRAIERSIDETGRFTGVSRIHIFEKDPEKNVINCNYEWCNKDIQPVIDNLKNIPMSFAGKWFDFFENNEYFCAADINNFFDPEMTSFLQSQEIKSIIVFPLTIDEERYGLIGFDECTRHREWDDKDANLIKSLSQIISSATQRKNAENSLHLSQQSMKTVLNSIDANITIYDFNNSTIIFANNKTKKSFGEDIEGKICWQTMHRGMTDRCPFCPRKYILDENNRPTGSYRWEYLNDFDNKWYECNEVAIEWVDGRLVHLQLEVDINDRKLAELELISAKERAEEADNLKSTFLANMSHEIRTPLNAIVGLLQFIEADNLSPEYREIVADMNTSAKHLSQLIDDIIDISRIEAKQMKIVPVSLKINELMNEMYQFFKSNLLAKNKEHIALLLDDSNFIDNCVIMVDAVRLRQILINLIGNAIKFTDKGYIRFGYQLSSNDFLEFFVEDTGVGLPECQQDIIFERFRQNEKNMRNHGGGSGLGLPISRNLVQLMGGDIWVKSTEGTGSEFYFTIPYKTNNQLLNF